MINGITATTTSAAGAEAMKKATGMNKDDFLKLFVSQLQNQDPLNPQDGTQFLAQLAQLTQVEQAYNVNTNLQNLIAAQSNTIALSAVSFIGKGVLAEGAKVVVNAGDQPQLKYKLSQPVEQVTIQISDAAGRVIRTLTRGASASGEFGIPWDGKDGNNQPVAAGTYTFSVSGLSAGNKIAGTPLMQGRVDGVRVDGTNPVLTVNGTEVPLSAVLQVQGG